MKFFIVGLIFLQLFDITLAASGCKRDACYSVVALGNAKNGNASQRKARCSSALKTVIDDDKIVTVTSYMTTAVVSTTLTAFDTIISETSTLTFTEVSYTTTTATSFSLDRRRAATAQITGAPVTDPETQTLEVRDKIIVSGLPPSYASACKDIKSYATACLCWGIKPQVLAFARKTKTKSVTIEATTTATFSAPFTTTTFFETVTETTTSVVASTTVLDPRKCAGEMDPRCDVCLCFESTSGIPTCGNSDECNEACVTDQDCARLGQGFICVDVGLCGLRPNRHCLGPWFPGYCPELVIPARQRAFRELAAALRAGISGVPEKRLKKVYGSSGELLTVNYIHE